MNVWTQSRTEDLLSTLRQMTDELAAAIGVADRSIDELNRIVKAIDETGLLFPVVITGPVFLRRWYSPHGQDDNLQIVQAALSSEFGAAAVFWNGEEFDDLVNSDSMDDLAASRSMPKPSADAC
ncbi:hypothetical protein [Crateriforma conspicua]|uniref:hypothetical protein n=1 Tax=Crateriforma conspicua TaxID=2527996 RepID=UPI0011B5B658|nr:hypothetical protein [Crateriforma conspicua]